MKDLFSELGVRLSDIVAGFSGGVVNAFVFKRSNPAAIVGSVVVGACTAAYLAPTAARYLGVTTGTTDSAAAFIVGLCGMAICQGLLEAAKRFKPTLPGGTNNG